MSINDLGPHDGCMSCGAEVDHYLGCPDDPNPDYEAEAELPERQPERPVPCPNCSATLYTHHHTECPRWGTEPPWEPLSRDWQLGRDDSVSLAANPPATSPDREDSR